MGSAVDAGEASEVASTSGRGDGLPWAVTALFLSVLMVGATYALLRWSSIPIGVAMGVLVLILVGLAVCGFLAARRGHAAPFVVVALLLPYAVAGAVVYGGTQRVADEISSAFDMDADLSDPGELTDTDADFDTTEGGTDGDADPECIDADLFGDIKVGMSQDTVTKRLGSLGTTTDGGAGGFTQAFSDCLDDTKSYYVTFDLDTPSRVIEKKAG